MGSRPTASPQSLVEHCCWNLCTWQFTLVELETWDESQEDLVDRGDRPWDNPHRRPCHADQRRQIVGKIVRNQLLKDLSPDQGHQKIRDNFDILLSLAV